MDSLENARSHTPSMNTLEINAPDHFIWRQTEALVAGEMYHVPIQPPTPSLAAMTCRAAGLMKVVVVCITAEMKWHQR